MSNSLYFGAVPPGGGASATYELGTAGGLTVTPVVSGPPFTITGMSSWILVPEEIDPGELPRPLPGHPWPRFVKVWEVDQNWSGSGPFTVPAKGRLTVDVALSAPPGYNSAGYHGTLTLHIAGQADVIVALNADSRGVLQTTVVTPSFSAVQGGVADLTFKIQSLAGPDTTVQYILWPDVPGVALLTTAPIPVAAGSTKMVVLAFSVDHAMAPGRYGINIVESAFGDLQRDSLVPEPQLTVGAPPPVPRNMTGTWTSSAQGIDVNMKLVQNGTAVTGSATTNLGPDVLPMSGSVNGDSVHLVDSTNTVKFDGKFTDNNTIPGTVAIGDQAGPATLHRS
jgi:hypothetical protein